jgi:hypothetical protein
MHSINTFTVSLFLAKPASSITKPACIPNTKNAAIKVQMVFAVFINIVSCGVKVSCAEAGVAIIAGSIFIAIITKRTPMILPMKIVSPRRHFSDFVNRTIDGDVSEFLLLR